MNHTIGPSELVRMLLVLDAFPRFSPIHCLFPDQNTCRKALEMTRIEMAIIVAQLRTAQALCHRVPPESNPILQPGMKARVDRETNKRLNGPYEVIKISDKQVYVNCNRKLVQFKTSQIMAVTADSDPDHIIPNTLNQIAYYLSH